MIKKVRLVKEDLYEALKLLGYKQIRQASYGTEWRRINYHLIVNEREGKTRMILRLHRDISIPIPPFHKAMHNTVDVKQEMSKILDAYQARRCGK